MAAYADPGALPAHLALLSRLLAEPDAARRAPPARASLDPAIYLSSERFAREQEVLFRKFPLALAHESELAEPGSLLAVDHAGVPALLARGRDGIVRAFLNACRHRNTKLVKPEDSGRRASIVCPYHSWTYGLDGALVNVPCEDQFPGLDKGAHALAPLPCATRGGLVFVTPDPAGAIDIDAHLSGFDADFAAFGLPDSVVFRKVERVKRANWKLVIDAFQDGYHIQHLHRHTIAPFFKDSCSINERAGRNLRAVVAREGFDAARGTSPEQWDIRNHATFSHYLFPNAILIMHPDYISIIALYPRGPGETLYAHTLLTPRAPQSEKERVHYERSFDLIENGVFQAEDLDVCERAQAAMEGGARWPMTLGAMERGVAMFHAILDEALEEA